MDTLYFRFFKSGWTDEEVKVATGGTTSEVVMHPLTLNSSYATVKVLNLLYECRTAHSFFRFHLLISLGCFKFNLCFLRDLREPGDLKVNL